MKDKQRKKVQRYMNSVVRAMNKNITNDDLWRGRFTVKQIDAIWERFTDGSGGRMDALIEVRDLKTGLYGRFYLTNFGGTGYHLWRYINDFIVKYSGAHDSWEEVKNDKTDYSTVKWIPKKGISLWIS